MRPASLAALSSRLRKPSHAVPISRRHIVIVLAKSGRSVDDLADDVGMPGVAVCLGNHMDEYPVEGHLALFGRPPGQPSERIQGQIPHRGV